MQVVQDGDKPTEGDELLSSFNVATFKQDVDDAAFWNRLIPVTERPKTEPAKAVEELGTRSTRYHRVGDDVSSSFVHTTLPEAFLESFNVDHTRVKALGELETLLLAFFCACQTLFWLLPKCVCVASQAVNYSSMRIVSCHHCLICQDFC